MEKGCKTEERDQEENIEVTHGGSEGDLDEEDGNKERSGEM